MKNVQSVQPSSPLAKRLSVQFEQASETTMRGWDKFQNWDRNHDYLRTVGGLLCIAFCLNWSLAGATFAFLSSEYTAVMKGLSDSALTNSWNLLNTKQQVMVLGAGIFMAVFGGYVSFFLFPIQIVASICAFKLGMDLAVKNMSMMNTQKQEM